MPSRVYVLTEFSRDTVLCRALYRVAYVYQPVPSRKNKSYEPISTATKRNADKKGIEKTTAEFNEFPKEKKAKRKYLRKYVSLHGKMFAK